MKLYKFETKSMTYFWRSVKPRLDVSVHPLVAEARTTEVYHPDGATAAAL